MKQRILFTRKQIAERVEQLGFDITKYYKEEPLTVIPLMNGAMIFAADLTRAIEKDDLFIDALAAASYENDASTGKLTHRSSLKLPVAGRHLLLVDDILDTGRTLKDMTEYFYTKGALSVRTCVLLSKELAPAKPARKLEADWSGFTVPDLYVIGYGLDSCEKYRNLPDIRVLEEE